MAARCSMTTSSGSRCPGKAAGLLQLAHGPGGQVAASAEGRERGPKLGAGYCPSNKAPEFGTFATVGAEGPVEFPGFILERRPVLRFQVHQLLALGFHIIGRQLPGIDRLPKL